MKKRIRPSRLPLPRRPLEWGLAIVAIALVVIAIASLGAGSSSSSAATRRTATVGKGIVQSTVSGNGTLEPAQKVELSFGASGEVTAIDVKSGEKVKKGQVLAEVDSSSARASLASAEAQLIEAEEAVEAAAESEEEGETESAAYSGGATTELADLTTEATGSTAPEGAAAVEPEATSTDEADAAAELEAAKQEAAKLGKEKRELEKRAKEAAAKAERSAAAGTSEAATPGGSSGETSTESAPVESSGGGTTESAGAGTGGGESSSTTAGASVSLPTAEANLREAELSVKSARQEVRETTLRAPISGTIAQVSGAVGETVSGGSAGGGTSEASAGAATGGESTGSASGSAFMVLAQLHRLKMEVSFSEADIGKVRKGQTATVSIDSMEGTELSGQVTKLSVLPGEGSSGVVEYPATILLSQSAKGLRAGMSASAEVVVEQVKNAITVPSEAITALDGKTVTVEAGGKEVTKTVTTGLEGDETTEVVSGLKAGETLVLPEVTVATASSAGSSEAEGAAAGAFPGPGAFSGVPPRGAGGAAP